MKENSFNNSISFLETELSERFTPRRIDTNQKLIASYERLGLNEIADHIRWCGSDLDFRVPADFSGPPKLFRANFCKERLCSMCAWRRSLKVFGQVSQIMDKLQADKYEFVFLTLTMRNCSADELEKTIDLFQQSFHRFNQRARVKRAFKGAFKGFEITYHPENRYLGWEYHPHFHIIYAVRRSYFSSDDYLSQKLLKSIWRECSLLDYDPVIHIQRVRPGKDKVTGDQTLAGAVAEVAKYVVDPDKIFAENYYDDDDIDEAVYHLTSALAHRRLCSFTGVFKKVAQELQLDDLNDGDLVQTDNEKVRSDVGWLIINYKWRVGFGYELNFVRKEEEKEDDN